MRRVQPWIVMGAAAMLVGAGCGSSQAPVVGGSTGTPADAGSSSDAGTTGDAGTTADAGTTTDAGPTADAGTPDAGTPDGGTDGGTAANDCDGILPTALGPSASANVDPSGSSMCTFATSDLAGNVALERHANSYSFSWTTFTSSGTRLGSLGAVYLLVPRDVGFLGVNFWNGAGAPMDMFHFFAWAPDGSSSGSTSVGSDACTAASFPSSSGGAIVLVACGSRSGNTRAIRFDASGKQLSSSVFLGTYTAAQVAVGDANGNTLIVAYPGTEVGFGSTDLVGRWGGARCTPVLRWVVPLSTAICVMPYRSAESTFRDIATGLYCMVILVAAEALG